jgi:hypothetical protein
LVSEETLDLIPASKPSVGTVNMCKKVRQAGTASLSIALHKFWCWLYIPPTPRKEIRRERHDVAPKKREALSHGVATEVANQVIRVSQASKSHIFEEPFKGVFTPLREGLGKQGLQCPNLPLTP